MKEKRKLNRLIIKLVIIGVSILSIWKIVLINTEYSQPSIEEKCMGEVIAITPDVDLKVLSMRIQSIDNINCDEKTKKAIKEIEIRKYCHNTLT